MGDGWLKKMDDSEGKLIMMTMHHDGGGSAGKRCNSVVNPDV